MRNFILFILLFTASLACHPQCVVPGSSTYYNAVCEPVCQPWNCSVVCLNGTAVCDPVQCIAQCAADLCESDHCPACSLLCEQLSCSRYSNPGVTLCEIQCQPLDCSWQCHKPPCAANESSCAYVCEHPACEYSGGASSLWANLLLILAAAIVVEEIMK